MANMKEIKSRINSVKSTNKITKAMEIVSSTKFKKFQALTLKTRDYSSAIEKILNNSLGSLKDNNHVFFTGKKEQKKIGLVVLTSDRGLCGSFNHATNKQMQEIINEYESKNIKVSVIGVGKKVRDYCKRKNIDLDAEYVQLIEETMFEKAKNISESITDFYMEDIYDEVHIIYSTFISALEYKLTTQKLLPLENMNAEANEEYIFDPKPETVLRSLVPKYLNIKIYQALLETSASEHSARKNAMKNASDNATDMIDSLTLSYNRARQASITQEITEIVSGVEALK